MLNEVERFKIGEMSACITKEDGKFKPWWNGCGICLASNTIDEARSHLHDWLKRYIDQETAKFLKRATEYQKLSDVLGNDVFNLGQFKTEVLTKG